MQKENNKKELVRNDINLEKWAIFTNRNRTKERSLSRKTQHGNEQVKIGAVICNGKSCTLTATEGKVYYVLLKLWEQAGRPHDRAVTFSIRSLCKSLDIEYNSDRVEQLSERLLNVMQVPITYIESYTSPNSTEKRTTSFTLLSSLEIFTRDSKNPKNSSGISSFKIHETIIGAIINKGIKPIRLDVIRDLKSDCAFILYRYLDLILFKEVKHEKDLLDIAEMCDLEKGQPTSKIKQTIAHGLAELVNKEITSGRIIKAEILKSQTRSGWKISIKKGKQLEPVLISTEPSKKTAVDLDSYLLTLAVDEQEEIRKKAERSASSSNFFQGLSEEEKKGWINSYVHEILKEKMESMDKKPANEGI